MTTLHNSSNVYIQVSKVFGSGMITVNQGDIKTSGFYFNIRQGMLS